MLDELTASNLGLIREAAVTLSPHLTVITGETGTGKTLMLGALRLLRGDKATKGVIGPDGESCDVAARFVDDSGERVVRRTVTPSRSRAYVDGVAAAASSLAEILGERVSIIGQHDQLTITQSAGVRRLIDDMLDDEGIELRRRYRSAWVEYRGVLAEIEEIGTDLRALERERDALDYQINEIDQAGLDVEEEAELSDRVRRLRNADALVAHINAALGALGDERMGMALDAAVSELRAAAGMDPAAGPIAQRLADLATEASDATGDLAVFAASVESDPVVLAAVEQRVAHIGDLKRKYGDSVDDILRYQKEASDERERLDRLLTAATDIEARLEQATGDLVREGDELREARADAARRLAVAAVGHLAELGFSTPLVDIDVAEAPAGPNGADRATILFASDADLTPGPVSAIASGGELSRLVLALTLGSGRGDAAVLAFDEIDAGIGGATALAMGEKLHQLGRGAQVVCVTHLPQVAAYADTHVLVERVGTQASVRTLDDDARLEEITRMLAGMSGSEAGKDHARELLSRARRSG